ncbi:MAG: hypothetical protein JST58_10995 [Bacteroidetes bacterium]|nr:hypothetical protein [Bacteroidota bacterium]
MRTSKKEITANKLMEIAEKATKRAWEENFALGLPIIIEENGNVVKKYKDGKTKLIKKIKK